MQPSPSTVASRYLDSYRSVLGLVVLVLVALLAVKPPQAGSLLEGLLTVAVGFVLYAMLVVTFRASAARRRTVLLVTFAGITVVVAGVVAAMTGDTFRPSIVWIGALVAAPIVIVRRVFQHESVTNETILGAISAYLLIAVAFTFVFDFVDSWTPMFATGQELPDFAYFSLVTITTLGYGDLSPVSEWGRLFAVAEAVIGQVFLVTIVARLVSLYRPGWKDDSRGRVRRGD